MIRIRDIMTREVLTVSPDLSIRDLMELLVSKHVSGVPVVSGDEVVGVVSATDVMAFATGLLTGSSPDAPSPERDEDAETEARRDEDLDNDEPVASYFTEMWSEDRADVSSRLEVDTESTNVLDSHTVSEVMTLPPLCTMSPDMAADYAADYMRRANVHRVLVMTEGRLEGILTTTDLANAVADHKAVVRTFVFDRRGRLS
jgi:CBS domain-containing protein